MKDKQSGKILFQGQLNKGLYPLHASRTSNKISHASFVSLYISSEIWHHRLGHLSATIQQAIFSNNSSIMSKIKDTKSICTSCQHGKSKKLSFSLSSHVSSKPLELIHSDVWGPAPTPSISGYKYYIIFIDDFSRYCWLFPLKQKSNSLSVFSHFKLHVENLLDAKIKTDGGGDWRVCQFLI